MSFILTEEERKIFDLLRLEGCCLRCCLRFTGCRNARYYQDLTGLEHLVCCLCQISYINDLEYGITLTYDLLGTIFGCK